MTRTYWQITAAADDSEAEVLIYDQIGEGLFEDGLTAKDFVTELAAITAPRIRLRINSPGGSVFDGMAIYTALRAHPAQVTAHVDGLAASIASVIALAADRVHMASNALFMIHNPSGMAAGDAATMRHLANTLDKVRETMVGVYSERCALTPAELEAALDAETWYTADEAAEAGFVDEITGPLKVAASFDLTMFDHPPTPAAAAAPPQEEHMPDPTAAPAAEPIIAAQPIHTTARMPTLAEYIIAMGRGDSHRLADYARAIRAAAPDTQVADVPGIIPEPIVTPVVNLRDASAPLFNALGPNTAPDGASFRIPKITTNLLPATAAAEQTDVTGQIVVGEVPVTMSFVKRAADISYEAIQYSNPGIVGIAQSELVDSVALGCEIVVCTGVEAATGTNPPVSVAGDGSNAWAIMSEAIADFYALSGTMPDVFAAAPDVWAKLAGMTNLLGGPLVQGVTQNLVGSWGTLFGLPVTVSPKLTPGKAFLLSTTGVKSWASGPVNLQLSQPTTFSYQLGGGRNVGLSVADGKFITPVGVAVGP